MKVEFSLLFIVSGEDTMDAKCLVQQLEHSNCTGVAIIFPSLKNKSTRNEIKF
jgi:hypothetical protein